MTPFLFDRDFRQPRAPEAQHAAALLEAERRGFAAGQAQVRAETQASLAAAALRLADLAGELLTGEDARQAAVEADAVAFATGLARKLAGAAVDALPLAAIEDAARAALQHLRGVPHLVVRVNDRLVEDVDVLIGRLARERGFDGRLVVLGEPDIPRGDARIEWADGGVLREQARIDDAAERALAAAFAQP